MKIKNKGFFQLPIIIAFLVGSIVFGGAGYLINKNTQDKKNSSVRETPAPELVRAGQAEALNLEKIKVLKMPNKTTSIGDETAIGVSQKQETDSNLKIAKCQASQQEAHNSIVVITNTTIDKAEKDEFDKLNQQMQQSFDEVYAVSSINKATIESMQLTSSAGTLAISENTADRTRIMEQIRTSYQTTWLNRKNELEIARKTAIEKADQILDGGYLDCLNQ